jgi:hypothetical protein
MLFVISKPSRKKFPFHLNNLTPRLVTSVTECELIGTFAVTLLSNGKLDTLALGKGDPGLLAANDEDVALTGGEGVVDGILEVDNVETSVVTLTVGDDADTTHVATAGDHGDGASVEPDEVLDLASLELNLDGVVDLDPRIGVADTGITSRQHFEGK